MLSPSAHWKGGLGKDLVALWILATVSVCAGLVINQMRDQPLSLVYVSKEGRLRQSVERLAPSGKRASETSGEARRLRLAEFRSLVEAKRGVILDARPEIFHRVGHVPGALSLSREEFERDYNRLKSTLEVDRGRVMIVYCVNSSCEDSGMVARALMRLGYSNVFLFEGGWAAWSEAGLPEEKS